MRGLEYGVPQWVLTEKSQVTLESHPGCNSILLWPLRMRRDKTPYCSLNYSQPPKLTVHYSTGMLNLLDTYRWALGGPGEFSITQQPWLNSCLCLHTHAHIPHTQHMGVSH